jgi:transcriptional regulator with XRE-family HTH domain
VLVDETGDFGESAGFLLNTVRTDPGTSFPVPLYAPRTADPFHCVILPARDPEAEIGTRRQMRELLAMTGWSQRTLASMLRTTHVTVARIAAEGASSRSNEVAERLAAVHACVRRLAPLAAGAAALRAALESPIDEGGTTAVKLLAAGEYPKAYRFALRLLTPAPAGPLLRSRPNVSKLAATVAVDEPPE